MLNACRNLKSKLTPTDGHKGCHHSAVLVNYDICGRRS